ncbi:hypothetical protein B566_EDAN014636 [Ephemera danica]|nr:hypothetical protein B566_EDAN014636 [Ephemera danica]
MRRNYKRANWEKFQNEVADKLPYIENLETPDSIDAAVCTLTSVIKTSIEKCVPLVKCNSAKDELPPTIKAMITDRNRLRRIHSRTGDAILKREINNLRSTIAIEVQKWKDTKWDNKVCELNTEDHSAWRVTQALTKPRFILPPLKSGNSYISAPQEKAQLLADTLQTAEAAPSQVGAVSGTRTLVTATPLAAASMIRCNDVTNEDSKQSSDILDTYGSNKNKKGTAGQKTTEPKPERHAICPVLVCDSVRYFVNQHYKMDKNTCPTSATSNKRSRDDTPSPVLKRRGEYPKTDRKSSSKKKFQESWLKDERFNGWVAKTEVDELIEILKKEKFSILVDESPSGKKYMAIAVQFIHPGTAHSIKKKEEIEEMVSFFLHIKLGLLKPCCTRWLALQPCIERLLVLWEPLLNYFRLEYVDYGNKKAQEILEDMNKPETKEDSKTKLSKLPIDSLWKELSQLKDFRGNKLFGHVTAVWVLLVAGLSITVSKSDKKGKRKRRKESYAIYIYKVLKQVHPDTGVSSKAMSIMNRFVNDIFERIAAEASPQRNSTEITVGHSRAPAVEASSLAGDRGGGSTLAVGLACQRDDRRLVKTSKVCSCHFPNGNRHELPSIYKHNSKRSSHSWRSLQGKLLPSNGRNQHHKKMLCKDPAIDLIDSEASEISIQHQELRRENRNLKLEI